MNTDINHLLIHNLIKNYLSFIKNKKTKKLNFVDFKTFVNDFFNEEEVKYNSAQKIRNDKLLYKYVVKNLQSEKIFLERYKILCEDDKYYTSRTIPNRMLISSDIVKWLKLTENNNLYDIFINKINNKNIELNNNGIEIIQSRDEIKKWLGLNDKEIFIYL